MIEVRLFAGLRQGRQKVYFMEPDSIQNVHNILNVFDGIRFHLIDFLSALTQTGK